MGVGVGEGRAGAVGGGGGGGGAGGGGPRRANTSPFTSLSLFSSLCLKELCVLQAGETN